MSYCDEAGLTMFVGHKYLYERGVLHRDISPGNILIKWRPGSEADESSTCTSHNTILISLLNLFHSAI